MSGSIDSTFLFAPHGHIDRLKVLDRDSSLAVIARFGINLCEYFVMGSVGYGGGGTPELLTRLSWSESKGDPRGDFPIEDHHTAVNTLIEKGLLNILTLSDVESEMSRRATSCIPELIDFDCDNPGDLAFTARGYAVFREVLTQLYGNDHIQHSDSGWNDDGQSNRREVLAPTRELCQIRVNESLEYLASETPPSIILSLSEPEAIGNWRPNRFVLLPSGYRAVIRYFRLENESD